LEKSCNLPEDIIKCNYFKLSLSGQMKIYYLYLNDLKDTMYYSYFKSVFSKYIKVVSKFSKFKDDYSSYTSEDKKNSRFLIGKCRKKINPNNKVNCDDVNYYLYDSKLIEDSFVDNYIYDYFSYSKRKKLKIALEFISCYYGIINYDFEQILGLFSSNKDSFNQEIRNLSGEFYSLYLLMNTTDRMKYIWYLSNIDIIDNCDEEADISNVFKNDKKFIKPLHYGSKQLSGRYKILCKYFKMDY